MEKTFIAVLLAIVLGMIFLTESMAHADDTPARAIDEKFELLDGGKGCHHVGALCLSAGDTMTTHIADQMVSRPGGHPVVAPVPKFVHGPDGKAKWTIELNATPRRSWTGNAIFLVFDAADPSNVTEGNYAAMFQAPIKAGKPLSARMVLDSEEGFRPDHAYKIRVVQIISGKETLLAEGDVALQ